MLNLFFKTDCGPKLYSRMQGNDKLTEEREDRNAVVSVFLLSSLSLNNRTLHLIQNNTFMQPYASHQTKQALRLETMTSCLAKPTGADSDARF